MQNSNNSGHKHTNDGNCYCNTSAYLMDAWVRYVILLSLDEKRNVLFPHQKKK